MNAQGNEPPRYLPLRALPARAYVPGQNQRLPDDPHAASSETAYCSAERWTEHASYLWGVDLYNHGFFWEAHEAWESAWRAAAHDALQHAFLQALILCAAACLKGVQRHVDAAQRITSRALPRLRRVQTQASAEYMGLEVTKFCDEFRSFVERDPTALASRPMIVLNVSNADAKFLVCL